MRNCTRVVCVITCGLAALSLHGCSSREAGLPNFNKPGIDQETVLAEMMQWQPPADAQAAQAAVADSEPVVAPDGNMLMNASFEARDDTGRPKGWIVSPIEAIVTSSEAGSDAYEGKEALTLRGHATNWTVVSMGPRLIDKDLGKTAVASAWGKVTAPNAMYLSISAMTTSGQRELARKSWPASTDKWTQLTAEAVLTPDVDPTTVRVVVSIRNDTTILARLDQVSFVLK